MNEVQDLVNAFFICMGFGLCVSLVIHWFRFFKYYK